MKTTIQKLTDKLCECEAVKEDINELRFGTVIEMREDGEVGYGKYYGEDEHFVYQDNKDWSLFMPEKGLDYNVIGNPLELRHLMMYCAFNLIYISVVTEVGSLTYLHMFDGEENIKIKLDNRFRFHEQSEEILRLILDFLNR